MFFFSTKKAQDVHWEVVFVSIYVEIRYLRPHFYSYPLMPSMTGAGVLQVMSTKTLSRRKNGGRSVMLLVGKLLVG
jgi:hypothetical protein